MYFRVKWFCVKLAVMKKLLLSLFTLGILGLVGYQYYIYLRGPCAVPLAYSIGRFDTNFGISEEYFKARVTEAERVWEEALGRELFVFDPEAKFTVNLIYDQRQAETELRRRAEFGLTAVEESFNKIDSDFENLKNEYDARTLAYKVSLDDFESLESAYASKVEYWNTRGGAPKKEFEELERERQKLNATAERLNLEANSLNELAKQVNALLESRNKSAESYNKIVKEYNQKYGHGVEFNQAEYVSGATRPLSLRSGAGGQVNIYQFTNASDLRLALAHEFGHSLGMDHTENEKSIMHYVTKEGVSIGLTPTSEDLAELRRVCK